MCFSYVSSSHTLNSHVMYILLVEIDCHGVWSLGIISREMLKAKNMFLSFSANVEPLVELPVNWTFRRSGNVVYSQTSV